MPKQNVEKINFNVGLMSPDGLARTDIARGKLSAEEQTNFVPKKLGSMMLRTGTKKIDTIYDNKKPYHIPFIFSSADQAILEMTANAMRVRVNEEIIQRTSVSSVFLNGYFTTDISYWDNKSETGGSIGWDSSAALKLIGTGHNNAIASQQVTIIETGIEHGIRIVVSRGDVILRIGSTELGQEYIADRVLREGVHSIAVVPAGNIYIAFLNRDERLKLVESVEFEVSGDMVLPTEWSNPNYIRFAQSGDVIFTACNGVAPKRIERYPDNSWSIVDYAPLNGPFLAVNSSKISLRASDIVGNISLYSSDSTFNPSHVGSLFQLTSAGQNISDDIAGEDQWTDPVKITGTGGSREFSYTIAGTWSVTQVKLQRSVGDAVSWVDTGTVYHSNGTHTLNDTLDNQIVYYRLGVSTGQYTSGTVEISISYPYGGITGEVRITKYISKSECEAEVLTPLGGTTGTELWSEGRWSPYRGYPSAVQLIDGRLWFGGRDDIIGSEVDNYSSFDDNIEGDSAPIIRSLGYGAVDTVNWILNLQRMVVGTESDERTARSTSLDEPLTPSNFNMKSASVEGTSYVDALSIGSTGVFVDASRTRVLQLNQAENFDYKSDELSLLCNVFMRNKVKRIVLQRKPEMRIHCVMETGEVLILVYDKVEDLKAWYKYETIGQVEDAVVLPANDDSEEDIVYYSVLRRSSGIGYPIDNTVSFSGSGRNERERVMRSLGYDGTFGNGLGDDWLNLVYGTTDVNAIVNSYGESGYGAKINSYELYFGLPRTVKEAAIYELGYIGAFGLGFEYEWLKYNFNSDDVELVYASETRQLSNGNANTVEQAVFRHLGYTGSFASSDHYSWLVSNYNSGDIDDILLRRFNLTLSNNLISTSTDVSAYAGTRYLEKVSFESECAGGVVNRMADCHVEFTSASATNIISGLDHLNGQYVVVWGNKKYLGIHLVIGGEVTVSENVRFAIAGLPYAGLYKSTKLAYASGLGTALCQRKKVGGIALIMNNTHAKGVKYGSSTALMNYLPSIEENEEVSEHMIWSHYDQDRLPIGSDFNTDSRLHLMAFSPKPCTILAAIVGVETNDSN